MWGCRTAQNSQRLGFRGKGYNAMCLQGLCANARNSVNSVNCMNSLSKISCVYDGHSHGRVSFSGCREKNIECGSSTMQKPGFRVANEKGYMRMYWCCSGGGYVSAHCKIRGECESKPMGEVSHICGDVRIQLVSGADCESQTVERSVKCKQVHIGSMGSKGDIVGEGHVLIILKRRWEVHPRVI